MANKIPFEVFGVTALVSLCRFPLTHRKYASSVSLITGHEILTAGRFHHWASISHWDSGFYMGIENPPIWLKN